MIKLLNRLSLVTKNINHSNHHLSKYLLVQPNIRNYKQLYRPKVPLNFLSTSSLGKFHIYHCEGGERYLNWLTRINVLFLGGNSVLLALELINPFFGYWHGVSQSLIVIFSLTGARMLHHYSTRMVNDIWLLEDGKHIEIEFMNAWMVSYYFSLFFIIDNTAAKNRKVSNS